jgi:hypothetical protein
VLGHLEIRGIDVGLVSVGPAQLLLELAAQDSARALERRLRHYAKHRLLVLDEVGYLAFDNRNADLLFQVISRRDEKKSVVLTTNLSFRDWPTIFPNATCSTALIDRIINPRPVVPYQTYLVTRRCYQRTFRLRPRQETNQVFLYCLALAMHAAPPRDGVAFVRDSVRVLARQSWLRHRAGRCCRRAARNDLLARHVDHAVVKRL